MHLQLPAAQSSAQFWCISTVCASGAKASTASFGAQLNSVKVFLWQVGPATSYSKLLGTHVISARLYGYLAAGSRFWTC
jgi:hypothetical protein